MSELESNPLGLPTKTTKKWKVDENTKVKEERRVLFPNFCPHIRSDTNKKCGNYMKNWDQVFYDDYDMCEECYLREKPEKTVEK